MASLAPPSGARKRPRNPDSWKQNKAKKARNSGEEYQSRNTGRTVPARRVGNPCSCQKQCFDVIGMDAINAIHSEFWDTGDHTLQTAFIQQHTTVEAPERRYVDDEAKYRSCSRKYRFMVADKPVQVCKPAFASVLGITLSRIDYALNSKTACGVVQPDARGKHKKHPRVAEDRLQLVLDHINSFPTVSSHYSR